MVARGAPLKQIQTSISELWGRSPSGGARVLEEALNHLEPGITIFDAQLQLVFANRRFIELWDIPEELGQVGPTFEAQVRFCAERGDYSAGEVEEIVTDHVELARRFEPHCVERVSADRTKSDFLAAASHELRTPMNAIMGFSQVIRSFPAGELNADQTLEYVEHIFQSGSVLLELIDDVLDFPTSSRTGMTCGKSPLMCASSSVRSRECPTNVPKRWVCD
jgi:signal transduction histidine kinase